MNNAPTNSAPVSHNTGSSHELPTGDFPTFPERPEYVEGQQSVTVRGRLGRHISFWRTIGASFMVITWLSVGYQLEWAIPGVKPSRRLFTNHASAHEHADFVTTAVHDLIGTGAAVASQQRPTVVSPLGVVPKPNGRGFRLILDLRYVNAFLKKHKFKYESAADLRQLIAQGDYLFAFDLQSGYHHVDIHPDDQQYLGFEWQGSYYTFTVLPFGLASAPFVFTKVMRELVGHWRGQGIRLLPYLDDFIFACAPDAGGSNTTASSLSRQVVADCAAAGLILNLEKSTLTPTKRFVHLGFWIDTISGVFEVAEQRWAKLQQCIASISDQPSAVPVRLLSRFTRLIVSSNLALGNIASLMTRFSYHAIDIAPFWSSKVNLTEPVVTELHFWRDLPRTYYTAPIEFTPFAANVTVFSDASNFGWGGHIGGGSMDAPPIAQCQGYFTLDQRWDSSTVRELLGILYSLQSFQSLLQDRSVVLYTDN